MTATVIRVQIELRKDTAANWTAANPILRSGEVGYETNTKKFKIGNGSTNWNSLAYLPIPDGSGNLPAPNGIRIGTATSDKLGFFNKTPIVQPAAVANATDAASVITQLNALLARMRDLGLIAT